MLGHCRNRLSLTSYVYIKNKLLNASCVCHAEGRLLQDQAQSVKDTAERVSKLRRVGKGLGVYQYDLHLQESLQAAA